MALEPGSETIPVTTTATELKKGMWHPHVYRTPPKSPIPFSIDDILKRAPQDGASLKNAHEVAEEVSWVIKFLTWIYKISCHFTGDARISWLRSSQFSNFHGFF